MEKRVDPANAAKIKKEGILKRKAEAEEAGDLEEMNRCEAELVGLENNAATANGSSLPSMAKTNSPLKSKTNAIKSQQERLALLNQKNRGKNADDVRKALLEERRKVHRERERARAEKEAKAEADADAKRLAQQSLLGIPGRADMRELFGDMSDFSRAGTPMSGVSTPRMRRSRQGTPMNGVPEKKKSALGLGAKKHSGEDDLGGLDLGIDVEI
jgi:RNA polymerase-associated protein RTF1